MKILFLVVVFLISHPLIAEAKEISLTLAGDVMLGRLVNTTMHKQTTGSLWGNVSGILRHGDITLINQEFAITNSKKKNEPAKAFHFRASPKATSWLKAIGCDYVSLANNHILDYGQQGLKDTLKYLDKAGIHRAGAGKNLNEATQAALIKTNGITIGIISLTDNVGNWKATSNQGGVNYIPINATGLNQLKQQIEQTKNRGAQLIIVSAHWGGNWVHHPSASFQSFARGALQAGVHLFHGHSPHVFQGVEVFENKTILYGLGDLVDDYAIKPGFRNDLGLIAQVTLDTVSGKTTQLKLYPTKDHPLKVTQATGNDYNWAANNLIQRSQSLGTSLKNSGQFISYP